jgi:HAD superfamily hydrolase (TIGR01509 family)
MPCGIFTVPEALANSSPRPDWDRIRTVLLDMDGTLLDLDFDNYFWLEFVPLRYGQARGMALSEAQAELKPRFAECHGSLQWYCTDHWSRELGLNIAALKHEVRERIRFLPGAEEFLRSVRQLGRELILVTNAHLDSFAVKAQHTGLEQYLDAVVSSHSFGAPKEHAEFWPQLATHLSLQAEQALFVDDNLAVLRAARAYGIGQLFAVSQPGMTMVPREISEFPAVRAVIELLP